MAREDQTGAERRVKRVKGQIDGWRTKRKRCSPMPEGLWREATALAREVGVHRIKCALGLNYETLKEASPENWGSGQPEGGSSLLCRVGKIGLVRGLSRNGWLGWPHAADALPLKSRRPRKAVGQLRGCACLPEGHEEGGMRVARESERQPL